MEWTRRIAQAAALGLAAPTIGLGLAAAPAAAQPDPPTLRVLDVRLGEPAVVGRETTVVVDAVDPRAPVSGVVVSFGSKREVFGISACRLPDSSGRVPRQFRPGARARLTAPLRFRRKGRRKVLVRVDSGGCFPLTSIYQPMTVSPTQPQERPNPLMIGAPSLIAPPGSGVLPAVLAAAPQPSMRILRDLAGATARRKRGRGCPGSGKRLGRSDAAIRQTRRALLCLLNKTRRAHRLGRLRGNPRLLRAAVRHSRSMVARRYFSHVEPGGVSPLDRIMSTGYLTGSRGFNYGENIGFGQGPTSSPRSMMRAWMNSSPHRANILTGSFREVGLGVVPGIPGRVRASGGTYTTVFGVRR